MLFHYFIIPYSYLKFTLSISFTYFRYYENMLHKNTSQCKILIVPEGWFGQPKYSTPSKKNHPTLRQFLLLYIYILFLFLFFFFQKICVIEEDEDRLLTVPALIQQRFRYSAFFRLK